MSARIKRRAFLAGLGGAAAGAWPRVARAQQQTLPVIGFLGSASPSPIAASLAAFHAGLKDAGFMEGHSVAIEYRWAQDRYDQLPALAAELVRRPVTAIVASGGPAPALAAKAATTTIPIIFTAVSDPVRSGLVASMNRPGANVTGVAALTVELDAKRLELLREIAPTARIAALVNPNRPDLDAQVQGLQIAARSVGQQLVIVKASSDSDIAAAFDETGDLKFGALLVGADAAFINRRALLLELLARHAMPAIFAQREFVVDGGLISYGSSLPDAYRQAGVYTGRVLKGDKPVNLPVVQPTKFEMAINLKTAKVLGLTVPQTLQVTADEVIE